MSAPEAPPVNSEELWVRVPGSTSNLGPGFDALGMAVDRFLEVRFQPGDHPFELRRSGTLADLDGPDVEDLIVRAVRENALGDLPPGVLTTHSEIPVGRGLGSSAAARVAGAILVQLLKGRPVDLEQILETAAAAEGHPDNAAPCVLGGLVASALLDDGTVHTARLELSPEIGWVYAAPGLALDTGRSRAALPSEVPHAVAARSAGRVALLLPALASGDVDGLRLGMADDLHVPHRLGLIPGAAEAEAAGCDAGAWAITLSGAGSGLIAVCPPALRDQVAGAMADAFRAHPGTEGGLGFPVNPCMEGATWGGA